jgi:hypothetical protein
VSEPVTEFEVVDDSCGLIPVLEVFDLPAPYRPFNPVFKGQLSGDDFTNSSTRHEPPAVLRTFGPTVSDGLILELAKVQYLVVQITAVAGTLPYEKIQQ